MQDKTKGMLLMVVCAVLWSTAGIFIKWIEWNPFIISGVRGFVSAVTVFIFMKMRGMNIKVGRDAYLTALGLGGYLRLGRGEEAGGGRTRTSIIADVVEAIIAAIYLDGGLDEARRFIYRFVLTDTRARFRINTDYKTMLQELVQRKKDQVLSYELTGESGPDHDKHFAVRVLLNGKPVGEGEGTSKKRAEQAAAQQAVERLFPDAL